jgi:hypothetical protein
MWKKLAVASVVAGGLFAFGPADTISAAPAGLAGGATTPDGGVVQVRRGIGGGHGFHGGGRHSGGFSRGWGGGRHFGGALGGRHFGGWGGRHFAYRGGWYGRRHHGRNYFLYGALPFLGWGAYNYGYGYYHGGCSWLWRRYRHTGSHYWYRRWRHCRGWY